MTTMGIAAAALVLMLGQPANAVGGIVPSAVEGQTDRNQSAAITRDEGTPRLRVERMRQRLQARLRVRALARAKALDRAWARADRAWARWYDGVFNRARARALRAGALDRVRARRAFRGRVARLRALDLDSNGVVSPNEWRRRREIFHRMDRNRDGVLSTDELQRPPRVRRVR